MKEGNSKKRRLCALMNPAKERLWGKIRDIEESLSILEKKGLKALQEEILQSCRDDVEDAKAYMENKWWKGSHPHLIWEFLHRVDENIVLLFPDSELYGKAADIKTYFDLNIKEEKIRSDWIGEKGKLTEAIKEIKNERDIEKNRYVVKDALRVVNEQMDRTFWMLSMNTMTSVLSGVLLGFWMYIFWYACFTSRLGTLGSTAKEDYIPLAILGLMGAYLSNLVTKEDFLFVRGGPFWRYVIHYLISKPVLSSFTAIFIYIIEKSKLIFSISPVVAKISGGTAKPAVQQIITISVDKEATGYVYAILAIASGFAADKVLRSMIDRVLKRLEEKAEKTKETKQK